jgi:AraC-like DNA-binding protein
MIVARVVDPVLRQAVTNGAHPEEEVVTDPKLTPAALRSGFPRLLVRSGESLLERAPVGIPVLNLDDVTLRRWESDRREAELPAPRLKDLTRRMRPLLERLSTDGTWVDVTLAELGRVAGSPLPGPLRTFGRHVLEFPSRHKTLHGLAECCQMSRGALKARFRRRSLASPYTYLRWFRLLAVAQVLSDGTVSTARAAHRLGFTSAGNLCRVIDGLAESTPTELRTSHGRHRLLMRFAWIHLAPDVLEAWSRLTELFDRRAA